MKLRTAIKPEEYNTFQPDVERNVQWGSRLVHETAIFMNGVVARAYTLNLPMPVIDATFVDQCMSVVRQPGKKVKPAVQHRDTKPRREMTREEEQAWLAERDARRDRQNQSQQLLYDFWDQEWRRQRMRSGFDYTGLHGALCQQLRTQMLTNINNSMWMPFFGRQKMVLDWQLRELSERVAEYLRVNELKDTATERNKLRSHLQRCINEETSEEKFKDVDDDGYSLLFFFFGKLIEEHRAFALFQHCVRIDEDELRRTENEGLVHAAQVLQYYGYLADVLERAVAFKQRLLDEDVRKTYPRVRTFSMLPLRAMKRCSVPITTTVLKKAMGYEKWEDVIRPEWLKSTPSRSFAAYITTDGVSVSLTMERERRSQQPAADGVVDLNGVRRGLFRDCDLSDAKVDAPVVGIDPGIHRPVQASNGVYMTNARYYEECGFTKNQQRRKERLKKQSARLRTTLSSLTAISFKTSDLAKWRTSWAALKPKLDACFAFFGHRGPANDKFWSYGRKKKCLERLKADLVAKSGGRDDVVVAFGNGSFPTSYRGNRASPKIGIAKFLSHTLRVVMTDEFRTSKLCSGCHHEQEQAEVKSWVDGVWVRRKSYEVLKCNHCGATHNRDANAARNIRELLVKQLQGEERPVAFRRAGRSTAETWFDDRDDDVD